MPFCAQDQSPQHLIRQAKYHKFWIESQLKLSWNEIWLQGFIGDFPREVNAAYTAWNLFNFPAGVLPVTKVTQEDQDKMVEKFSASGKVV